MTVPEVLIEPLDPRSEEHISQTAALLHSISKVFFPNAWPTVDAALIEVRQSLVPERISLVAILGGRVVGWVGGIPQYDGHVYELHPLVVDLGLQRKGIGSSLVKALEREVTSKGGLTLCRCCVSVGDMVGQMRAEGKDGMRYYSEDFKRARWRSDLPEDRGHPVV